MDQQAIMLFDRVPRPVPGKGDLSRRDDLGDSERKIYPLVDGSRSIIEIVESARLGEFEAYAALHQLLSVDLIRFDPVARAAGA